MKDIFESGLEAVEIPSYILTEQPLTPTATRLYQVMLLNYNRKTQNLNRAKVKEYASWCQSNKTSIYAAGSRTPRAGLY